MMKAQLSIIAKLFISREQNTALLRYLKKKEPKKSYLKKNIFMDIQPITHSIYTHLIKKMRR